MKSLMKLLMLGIAIAVIPACNDSKGSNSDPKEVLQDFIDKLGKKDFEGAQKLVTADSKPMLSMLEKKVKQYEANDSSMKEDPSQKFRNAIIEEAKISGDTAYVPIRQADENIEFDFPLKKEDGAWKVNFTFETMLKMGIDAAKKKGLLNDSTDLKDLREKLHGGIKIRDSILKNTIIKDKMKEGLKSYDTLMKAN